MNISLSWIRNIALSLMALAPMAAHATDVTLDGSVGYEISGGVVTITADRITNNTTDTTSGTLFLTLWATTSSSPSGSGYELASIQLSHVLGPNEYFDDVSVSGSFSAPPDGTYYLHVLLSEYPNLDSYIDSVSFSGTETFGGGSDGGSGGSGGDGGSSGGGSYGGYISLSGNMSYSQSGDSVTIEIEEVANNSSTTTSGTLFITLWATTGSDPVGSGYTLAEFELGTLSPGYYYSNISQTVSFTSPPEGTYYVHLLVTEYPNTDTILDYATFPGTEYFAGSSGGGGGGGGGGDDGGSDDGDSGGGAFHPLALLALLGLAPALRRRRG